MKEKASKRRKAQILSQISSLERLKEICESLNKERMSYHTELQIKLLKQELK